MLVLFETAAGYSLFRVDDEGILSENDLCSKYTTTEEVEKVLHYLDFKPFEKTIQSVEALKKIREGEVDPTLEEFLRKNIVSAGIKDKLQVSEATLAKSIQSQLGISCVSQPGQDVPEIFNGMACCPHINLDLSKVIVTVAWLEPFWKGVISIVYESSAAIFKFFLFAVLYSSRIPSSTVT